MSSSQRVWAGIWAYVERLLNQNAFGKDFPIACPDDPHVVAYTDDRAFRTAYQAEIPDMPEYLKPDTDLSTLSILDFVEFCHRHVAKAEQEDYHDYFRHHHWAFDRASGQAEFRREINLIFSRNGLAYQLQEDGRIVRLAPPVLNEALVGAIFSTGDVELDGKLNDARRKFLSRDDNERRQALESLWDAWERLKTSEGGDARQSSKKLLEKAASEPNFQQRLNDEALELWEIGNQFMIRHHAVSQIPLQSSDHVDYLFHRMFALVYLILKSKGFLR